MTGLRRSLRLYWFGRLLCFYRGSIPHGGPQSAVPGFSAALWLVGKRGAGSMGKTADFLQVDFKCARVP